MDEWKSDGKTDGRTERRTDRKKDGRTERRTDRKKDGQKEGWTKRRTDGRNIKTWPQLMWKGRDHGKGLGKGYRGRGRKECGKTE